MCICTHCETPRTEMLSPLHTLTHTQYQGMDRSVALLVKVFAEARKDHLGILSLAKVALVQDLEEKKIGLHYIQH